MKNEADGKLKEKEEQFNEQIGQLKQQIATGTGNVQQPEVVQPNVKPPEPAPA